MASPKFEQMVRKHAIERANSSKSIDWDGTRTRWVSRVSDLLNKIEAWLKPLIDSQTIEFTRKIVTLKEQALGEYEVESCVIQLGDEKLTLNPIGAIILSAYGRIDMDGPNGSVMLLLADPEMDLPMDQREKAPIWYVSHPKYRSQVERLTPDVFERVFADLFAIGD